MRVVSSLFLGQMEELGLGAIMSVQGLSATDRAWALRTVVHQETLLRAEALSDERSRRYEAHIRDLVKNAMPLAGLDARAAAGRKGMTYLLLYDDTPKFVALAQFFRIWQHPRSHYRFLQVIEFDQDLFLIADVRFCPLLPDHMRLLPSNAVAVVPAKEGNTCEQACAANRGTCSPQDMPWLNSCKKLKQFFPCERGCLLEAGMDLPAYVSSVSVHESFCLLASFLFPSLCSVFHGDQRLLCDQDAQRAHRVRGDASGNESLVRVQTVRLGLNRAAE